MELYKSSFVPTVVDEWNALSTDVRESDSVRIFKEKIHVSVKNENVLTCRTRPNFFIYGDRFLNIIHTRLRHNCALNSDLFRCNIINSPLCSCGNAYFLPARCSSECYLFALRIQLNILPFAKVKW